MRGEICWRRAGVRSGLGSYGENGLLVTKEFGSAIRISGVVTTAALEPDSPLQQDACDHCGRCLAACPVSAFAENGEINKKLCGNHIFTYGFRFFEKFVEGLRKKSEVNHWTSSRVLESSPDISLTNSGSRAENTWPIDSGSLSMTGC